MDESVDVHRGSDPTEVVDTTIKTENAALKRALERVKRDAEAELHAGHHTHHNSHSAHNTCMII